MKAVITGVVAIGLAMTMPAFAQTPQNNPIGQYNQGSAATPQNNPIGQYNQGSAATPRNNPIGQYNQGGATAQKTAAKKSKKQQHQ